MKTFLDKIYRINWIFFFGRSPARITILSGFKLINGQCTNINRYRLFNREIDVPPEADWVGSLSSGK